MLRQNRHKLLCIFALTAILSQTVLGICPNSLPADEQLLWNAHNCDSPFISWFRDAYNLKSEDWGGGWGWNECDPNFAFPKMVNAGFLLANGVDDSADRPWHSASDYSNWGNAHGDDFHYKPVDASTGFFAMAFAGWLHTDRVEMYCAGIDANAALRASTLLHEATHVVYWEWNHQANNPINNCGTKPCTDDWLFHSLGSYPFGDLRGNKHSMVQIEVEFLCDLGEFPKPFVPMSIAQYARSLSVTWMNNRIRTPPGWTCGLPRPLPAPPPPLCQPGEKCCDEIPTGCLQCVPLSASCP